MLNQTKNINHNTKKFKLKLKILNILFSNFTSYFFFAYIFILLHFNILIQKKKKKHNIILL